MHIKGHGIINQFAWSDDDSGFATCDAIGNCYFYDLATLKETNTRKNDEDFFIKGTHLTGICLIPNQPFACLAVGDDRKVHYSEND